MIGNLLDVPHGERDPLRDWSLAILGAGARDQRAGSFARDKAVQDFLAYLEIWSRGGAQGQQSQARRVDAADPGRRERRAADRELLLVHLPRRHRGTRTTTNPSAMASATLSDHPAEAWR